MEKIACNSDKNTNFETLLAQEVTRACLPTGGAVRLVPPCAEGSRSSRPTPRLAWLASDGVWDSVCGGVSAQRIGRLHL
ncbi:unnamed protein product [Boreogadus saida]